MKKHLWILGLFVALISTKAVHSNNAQVFCATKNHLTPSFCLGISEDKKLTISHPELIETIQAEINGEEQEIILYELASQNNLTLNELKTQLIK